MADSEDVIQNYACNHGANTGNLYITQNYVCWEPTLVGECITLPFHQFHSMQKERGPLYLLDNSLRIKLEDGQEHGFSGFVHRDETYNLLEYLWKNPPPKYLEENERENIRNDDDDNSENNDEFKLNIKPSKEVIFGVDINHAQETTEQRKSKINSNLLIYFIFKKLLILIFQKDLSYFRYTIYKSLVTYKSNLFLNT